MASKIKNAIKDFLSSFARIEHVEADKITDAVLDTSTSKTPERSINVALNNLWRKGIVDKYYSKDGDIYKYPTDKPVSREYQRLYRIREEEFIRVELSIDIYCGIGKVRKEAIDVKMFTFVNPAEYKTLTDKKEVEDHLSNELLMYLKNNYPECYYVGENEYVKNTAIIDQYGIDDSQPTTDPPFEFPETDFEES